MPTDKSIPRDIAAYPVVTPVSLRYSDQDPMRHINNVAITAILESGRSGLMEAIFQEASPKRGMVLVSLMVDYLHEITFPDTVEVAGRLEKIGGRSMTTQYAIFQNGTCCVLCRSVNVFFDMEARRSAAPSDEMMEKMTRFLAQQT